MFHCVYNQLTGQFLSGGPCEARYDPNTEGVVDLVRLPSQRLERYDGVGGVRAATVQEVSGYDAAKQAEQEQGRFDGDKLVKALAIWTAGKLNVPPSQARQEILTIYRGL